MPYRAVLAAVSLLLLGALGGAAGHPPPRPPAIIPAHLGDTVFLDGDRLFVVTSDRVDDGDKLQSRLITTYRLPEGRVVARTTVAVAGTVLALTQVGDTLVMGYRVHSDGRQGVVAQAAGAPAPRWVRAARLLGVSAADGVALIDDGEGEMAVEVGTGVLRWRVPKPDDGILAPAGAADGAYPAWIVLVTDGGRLATWDARTGRPIAAGTVPTVAGRSTGLMWPVGDLVLVYVGDGYDAYRLPGLGRLWHTTADLSQSWMETDCGVVICTFRQQRGMTALDPRTGREVWRSARWAYAEPFGSYLLSGLSTEEPALWVLDPATGRPLGNFGKWQGLGPAGHGLLYGKTQETGKYRIWYGLLDPATRRIDYLGSADHVSGDCRTSTTADPVLMCRLIDASYAVWRLR